MPDPMIAAADTLDKRHAPGQTAVGGARQNACGMQYPFGVQVGQHIGELAVAIRFGGRIVSGKTGRDEQSIGIQGVRDKTCALPSVLSAGGERQLKAAIPATAHYPCPRHKRDILLPRNLLCAFVDLTGTALHTSVDCLAAELDGMPTKRGRLID
jgi:hypothetical protein